MSGSDEAKAFDDAEFLKIQQSNMKKVDFIGYVAEKALNSSLVTENKWYQYPGKHPKILIELIKEHWMYSFFLLVSLMLALVEGFSWLL